jgi:hypothetical protein
VREQAAPGGGLACGRARTGAQAARPRERAEAGQAQEQPRL